MIFSGVLVLGLCPSAAHAAGFYLQEQSASAMGTAFAGVTAMPRDASIVYYNPAGMTALGSGQVYAGFDVIVPWGDLSDNGSTVLGAPISGVDSDDPTSIALLPNLYAAYPIYGDSVWAGIAVSTPFGLANIYKSNWFGRYDSIKSELKTIDIAPSLAVKVSDWLSVGGGVNIQYADALLTSAVTNGATEGLSKLEGDDWSLGFNAGILAQISPDTRLGVHYRSRIFHTLEGQLDVTGVVGLNESTPGLADLDLPDIASVSLVHDLNDRWTVMGQANWFGWNQFEGVTAIRKTNNTVASNISFDYSATWSFGLGAEYKWDDDLTLRFGYEFDETPTADKDRSTRVPDGDRNKFAGGFTYDISPTMSVDFGAMYAIMSDERVNVSRNGGLAQVKINREDSGFAIVSAGISYKF